MLNNIDFVAGISQVFIKNDEVTERPKVLGWEYGAYSHLVHLEVL